MGEPSEAARDADSLTLLRYGLSSFVAGDRAAEGRGARQARARVPRRARRPRRLVGGPAIVRRGQRFDGHGPGRPGRAARADPRGGPDRHRGRARRRAGRRARPAPHGDPGQHGLRRRPLQGANGSVIVAVVIALLAVGSLLFMGLRRRAARRRRAVRRRESEGGVIITVTLNAAIDKSLSVPNFRLGGAIGPSSSRRSRAARASTSRARQDARRPVIATGLAGGPTGTRIVEQLTQRVDPQRLRPHPRGIAHEHRRASTRPRQQTRSTTRPGGHRAEIELFRDKLMYLAGGAEMVIFAGPCRAASPPTSTAT